MRLRALSALGEDKSTSREARKESRSLGIFKGVSNKSPESPNTSSPPQPSVPEPQSATATSQDKPVEKTTKTAATYYPKLSRQESLIRPSPSSEEPRERKEPVTPASALSAIQKTGYESDSDNEFPPEWNSPTSVALKPYSHQVGGHSALFRFSRHAVCKPLIEKENAFYQDIEINRPECNFPNPLKFHH